MKIIYSAAITKDVRKIKDQRLIDKITLAIKSIKEAESINEINGVKKMKGYATAYRIRIGDYRLGFYFNEDCITLARFVKRNDIYRVFP